MDALLETGHKQFFGYEPWAIVETEVNPRRSGYWESIFALTNGYMGLRGTHEEDEPLMSKYANPGMFINGVYEFGDYNHLISLPGFPKRGHSVQNLSDWRIINIYLDDEKFEFSSGRNPNIGGI